VERRYACTTSPDRSTSRASVPLRIHRSVSESFATHQGRERLAVFDPIEAVDQFMRLMKGVLLHEGVPVEGDYQVQGVAQRDEVVHRLHVDGHVAEGAVGLRTQAGRWLWQLTAQLGQQVQQRLEMRCGVCGYPPAFVRFLQFIQPSKVWNISRKPFPGSVE